MSDKLKADDEGIILPRGLDISKSFTVLDSDDRDTSALASWHSVIDAELHVVAACPSREIAELVARALNELRTDQVGAGDE
jgi:hypothetical protein